MYLRRIGKTDCVPNGSHVGAKVVFSFFKGAFKVFYLWKWDMFHRLLFLHVCYRNVEWSSVVLPMDFVCQNIEFGFQPVRHLTRPSFFYLLVSMNDFPRNVCTCGGKNYLVRRKKTRLLYLKKKFRDLGGYSAAFTKTRTLFL